MQWELGFLAPDIRLWRKTLAPLLKGAELLPRRRPVGQLVKSMISGRTRDPVSQAAYDRLVCAYPRPAALAEAAPAQIERAIGAVTFAAEKAVHVAAALRMLRDGPQGFRLEMLAERPLASALGFLEALPGVGRKVAASTLNASTLSLPVFIVDTHVWRVLRRLGAIGPTATPRDASETITAAMPCWTGQDFLDFHVLTKRLGQLFCRPEAPPCGSCPLATVCPSAGKATPLY